MSEIISFAEKHIKKIEDEMKVIDRFLKNSPKGSLKIQVRNGKTYYYRKYTNDDININCISNEKGKENIDNNKKCVYIKRDNIELVKALSQKKYYKSVRTMLENNLNILNKIISGYSDIEDVYVLLNAEIRKYVVPIDGSVQSELKKWFEENYEKTTMYSENLKYETVQGEMVRSKSEAIIANMLHYNKSNILYKYERPLEIVCDGVLKTVYPDFTIINKVNGKIKYWEHAGRMDDPYYANDFVKKINTYIANDILPGRDLIITYESMSNPLDTRSLKKIINELLD